MTMRTIRCHVLGANVVRVSDMEGAVSHVICHAFEPSTGLCRLRRDALSGGPLSQLMERVAEETLAERGGRCVVR